MSHGTGEWVDLAWDLHVPAPRARVFAAITEGRHLAEWFCDEAECAPGAGGAITMRWLREGPNGLPYQGRWVEWRDGERAAYEGGHAGYPDGFAGRIEWTLAERDGGTALSVLHRLPARPEYQPIAERYADAWPRALARLIAYLTPEDR